jgi:hypothetical protein
VPPPRSLGPDPWMRLVNPHPGDPGGKTPLKFLLLSLVGGMGVMR